MGLGYVSRTIDFPLTATPKRYLGKNEIPGLLAERRSSVKVLVTKPDIAYAVKENLGALVVYVFACLHLARTLN